MPYFRKADEIGSSQHLINKLLRHFIASLVSNGLGFFLRKMKGRNQRYNGTESILSKCIISDDKEEEEPDRRRRNLQKVYVRDCTLNKSLI